MGDTINTLDPQQGLPPTTWILHFDCKPPIPNFLASHPSTDPHNGFQLGYRLPST